MIEKEKLDSFNIPFYGASLEDLQSIVEMERSFEIESMKLLSGVSLHPFMEVRQREEQMYGRMVGNYYRSVFENLVATLLGSNEKMVAEIFNRIAKTAAAKNREFLADAVDVAISVLIRKRD